MFKPQYMALFLLSASWAVTVEAQDVDYSSQPLETCLQGATTALEEQACIGLASQACQSANDLGGTTVGMVACGSKEAEFWDGKLNEIYGSLVKKAEANDKEMKEIGATVPLILPALRDMQRAWITYRDRTCDYEYSQWGGGTGGGPASVACQSRMTALQYIYLKHSWPFENRRSARTPQRPCHPCAGRDPYVDGPFCARVWRRFGSNRLLPYVRPVDGASPGQDGFRDDSSNQ